MTKKNSVVFKGSRDGIVILLDDGEDFETLKTQFTAKVSDAKRFFAGAKSAISFRGRTLSEAEERELLEVIADKTDLDISFLNTSTPVPPSVQALTSPFILSECMTAYHMSGLRSGQSIRYAGSVVVLGDVNPGAEIIASGNIIVLGAARGLLFAGCNGNTECFISAFSLWPVQLRIADVVSHIPDELQDLKKKEKSVPVHAYLKEGKMYIEQLLPQK